jgi:hypothetical protein
VDRAQRHAELRNFPVFGVPLLLLLASACLGLLCVPPPAAAAGAPRSVRTRARAPVRAHAAS